MDALSLDVRLDGFVEPIGVLARDSNGAVAYAYRSDYVTSPDAVALSLSLPLTDEPYGDVAARPFFDNLLQERDAALADIMAREGLARDDIAGLLFHLGKDCAGALSVLPAGAPSVKLPGDYGRDYIPVGGERMEQIVDALHRRRRLPDGTADPSPLAGVQSKIALTMLPDGSFGEPRPGSGAPTTHILKVPDQGHLHDARDEAEALSLSRALGFETTDAVVVPFDAVGALLITRFDRARTRDGRIVRIHQEDFAQALGFPAALKYERRGTPGRRFDAPAIRRVLEATADPSDAKEIFVRATLFDLMIGNTDGHAKNFALYHEARGRIRMAPRYDLLPTRLDANLTDELAYRIGSADRLEAISADDFSAFLQALGIDSAAARKRMRAGYTADIGGSLAQQLAGLDKRNMKRFADLIASNIATLTAAFGVGTPAAVGQRDAFLDRAGGWLMS
ncbi:HipA domain-containing protein [Mesorhizobium loti]|uniref:Type II toxin-antitoxin system HipA family toxin n=1 Tax=Mesorhizobium loti R88b TaxID=935548 RepID=A0A6M7WVB2_RHILI|nr:HipA domain-containing protein [Mesorhizobium loti]QKD02931.1 type II toxin-antitoxin system HipA family toxin [Mesorhizobium loti R88b]